MDSSYDSDEESLPDFKFKYVAQEELYHAIKKVRRDRQQKHEQCKWDEFCRLKQTNGKTSGDHATSSRSTHQPPKCSSITFDANIQVELSEACTKIFNLALEEKNSKSGSLETASTSDSYIQCDQEKIKTKHNRSKSLPVKYAQDEVEECCFVPPIDLQSLDEEIQSCHGKEYTVRFNDLDSDDDSIVNSVYLSKPNTDHETESPKKSSTKNRSKELVRGLSDEDGSDSQCEIHRKENKTLGKCYNSSISDSSSGTHVTLSPHGITFEDPLFVNKVKNVRSKIGALLEDISISPDVLEPNSPAEQLKFRKRDLEFYSRFSRNYLYELQRQIIKLGKLVNISRREEIIFKTTSQKLIGAHQLVLRALQAYFKHAPTSLELGIPERLRDLTNHFIKLTDLCVNVGILDHDELRPQCMKLLEESQNHQIKNETQTPDDEKPKPIASKKSIPAHNRGASTARSGYSVKDSPYFNKNNLLKKRLNLKSSLQSITEHQIFRQNSAPKPRSIPSGQRNASGKPKSPVSKIQSFPKKKMQINNTQKIDPRSSPLAAVSELSYENSTGKSSARKNGSIKTTDRSKKSHKSVDTKSASVKTTDRSKMEVEKIQSIARIVAQETIQPFLNQLIDQNKERRTVATDTRDDLALGAPSSRNDDLGGANVAHHPTVPEKPDPTLTLKHSVTTTCIGPRNAKLICVLSTQQEKEEIVPSRSEAELKTEEEKLKGRGNFHPLLGEAVPARPCVRKKSRLRHKSRTSVTRMNREPLEQQSGPRRVRMPEKMLRDTLAYKDLFHNAKDCNPMFNRMWEKQPLELIESATEDILEEALLGIVRELSCDNILQSLVDLEFCPM